MKANSGSATSRPTSAALSTTLCVHESCNFAFQLRFAGTFAAGGLNRELRSSLRPIPRAP
jgi:hypothetical protein